MTSSEDDAERPFHAQATRARPERKARPSVPGQASRAPRPAARSILQGLLPPGAEVAGVRLHGLQGEPEIPEFREGDDKYTLHGVLGEGGMGRVYLARDEDLRRPVALKVARLSHPDHVARFIAEAQVMGQLHHPAIVPVFELGESQDQRLFYAMPVVRGLTLHDVIERLAAGDAETVRRWSLTRLMQVFVQVCQAVAYAHDKGVLHRDLKPANIMVGRHGEVQVLDWGIARIVRTGAVEVDLAGLRRAEADVVLGTPAYMSPEQARGEAADERSDVYSLGVVLYELLTLNRPFEGDSEAVLRAILQGPPDPPRLAAPGREIPVHLELACLTALGRLARERQQTVQELADEVQSWLEAESDRTRRRLLADAKAAEGKALLDEHERLKAELVDLEAAVKARASAIESWRSIEDKLEVLADEDAARRARRSLTRAASRAVATLTEALGFDSDHEKAREGLADYYWSRLTEAERTGQEEDVAFFSELTSAFHDGKYARALRGDGSLTLTSDPPGAEVWLHDFVEERSRLEARNPRLLGVTPLPTRQLPMGSYLVILKAAGFRDTRYPVFISRNKEWTGRVTLFTDDEVGEGFVHVPAGDFLQGGDPDCRGWDLPRSEPWVDDYCMATHPVTNGEYLEYLNDVATRQGLTAAMARSPRRVPDAPDSSYFVDKDGRLTLAEADAEGDAWLPGHPATGISWHDAVEYCEWRSARDGREVRLPTESEWEKAARGVDGRWFPWGNRFEVSFCNMVGSRRPGEAVDVTIADMATRYPADVSLFGVRGLAGNVRDWTSTRDYVNRDVRAVRGGCWSLGPLLPRCATRDVAGPMSVFVILGFRLARSLPARGDQRGLGATAPDSV